MKLNTSSQTLIQQAIRNAVGRSGNDVVPSVITDIHLQPNPINGELIVMDDDDSILEQTVIQGWIDYQGKDFYKRAEASLRALLIQMKEAGEFDQTSILNPFTFVLIDEDKETIADLLLIDDDTIVVSEELLKGLNEELDSFLKNLLEN
ncbi:MAG: hypothetical protein LIP08_09305 [Bacteroides sp.]|nr:hypothetical protein [Bacteroides sp.]